jgi:hypothetical protein
MMILPPLQSGWQSYHINTGKTGGRSTEERETGKS